MSVDLYAIVPVAPKDLRPRLIGLGDAPFVWPDADSPQGWHYPNASVTFSVQSIAALRESFGKEAVDAVAPRRAKCVLSLYLREYRDGLEHDIARALGGVATTDYELVEGPPRFDDNEGFGSGGDEGDDDDDDDALAVASARRARAAFWGARYAHDGAESEAIVAAAVRGDLGAIEVLLFWHGGRQAVDALRARVVGALAGVAHAPDALLALFVLPQHVGAAAGLPEAVLERAFSAEACAAFQAFERARLAKQRVDGGNSYAGYVGVSPEAQRVDQRFHDARSRLHELLRAARLGAA